MRIAPIFLIATFALIASFSSAATTKTLEKKAAPPLEEVNLYFRFMIVEHSKSRGDLNRFSATKEPIDAKDAVQDFSISLPNFSGESDQAAMQGTVVIGSEVWTFVNESIVKIGDGKLIVDTALHVKNGKQGKVEFITQEPYPTVKTIGNNQQNVVEFIKIGIEIDVKPQKVGDIVGTEVQVKVSEVMRQANEGDTVQVPVVTSRDTSTYIDLKMNQMEVLTELTTDKKLTVERGLPFLRNIPFLGPLLFSSFQDVTTQTKLYIVGGVTTADRKALRNFKEMKKVNQEEIDNHFPMK